MDLIKAIIIAIIEGLTEYLPISSTAHMGFTASLMGLPEDEFLKMFQVSIQFGAILSVVVAYWKKFFDLKNLQFYFKLAFAVVPALVLGYLFDDTIEAVLGNQIAISSVLVLGGVVLLFADEWFKNPKIDDEKGITIKKSSNHRLLAMSGDDAGNQPKCGIHYWWNDAGFNKKGGCRIFIFSGRSYDVGRYGVFRFCKNMG